MENNEETSLHGRDLDSWTPPWEHDNACIRLPALFFRNDVPRFTGFILSHLHFYVFWRLLLFLCLAGILLSVKHEEFPLGLLLLFSGMVVISRLIDAFRVEDVILEQMVQQNWRLRRAQRLLNS